MNRTSDTRSSTAGATAGLLLACVLALAGCGRPAEKPAAATGAGAASTAAAPAPLPKPPIAKYQRDVYSRLDDCVADWGFAGKCTPVPDSAPEKARGGAFFGPIYSNALRGEAQLATRREAFEQGYLRQVDENPSDKSIGRADVRS
jgi:hypothetical protein